MTLNEKRERREAQVGSMTPLHHEAYRAFVSFAAQQRIATAENWAALPEPVRDAIAADYAAFNADVEQLADQLHDDTMDYFSPTGESL